MKLISSKVMLKAATEFDSITQLDELFQADLQRLKKSFSNELIRQLKIFRILVDRVLCRKNIAV